MALVTRASIFAIGFGMREVAFRLPAELRKAALSAGAQEASGIGPEWVAFHLWEPGQAQLELRSWTQHAWVYANTGGA